MKEGIKNFLKKIGKISALISGGVLLFYIIIFGVFFLISDDLSNYALDDFNVYVRIDSIREVYDNLIDLKASDVIFSNAELRDIHNSILNFKSKDISKNPLLRFALNIKADIYVKDDFKSVAVFDLGMKSGVLFFKDIIFNMIENDKVGIKSGKVNNLKFYTIATGGREYYLYFKKNLVFFGFEKSLITQLLDSKKDSEQKNDSLNEKTIKEKIEYLRKEIKSGGIGEVVFNTSYIREFLIANPDIEPLMRSLDFDDFSSLSFSVSNSDLFFSSFTGISTNLEILNDFLLYDPGQQEVTRYLPDNTNLYFSINFKSFREFYKLFLYFKQNEFDEQIKKLEKASQTLFKMSIDDIAFSWVGSNVGIYTDTTTKDPVIYAKISDRKQFDRVLKQLTDSIVFEEDKKLIFNNVSLNRIKLPGVLQSIVNSFVNGFYMPYFKIVDDYIFFSVNPNNLSNMYNKYRAKQSLSYDTLYKKSLNNIPRRANIFLYYNMADGIPKFLSKKNLLSSLLRLYERGTCAVSFTQEHLKFDLSATGVYKPQASLFPGFPRYISDGINGFFDCDDIFGTVLPEFIYIDSNDRLHITDISHRVQKGFPVKIEKDAAIIIPDTKSGHLYTFSKDGIIQKINENGENIYPFPVVSGIIPTFDPYYTQNRIVSASKDKELFYIYDSGKIEDVNLDLSSPILAEIDMSASDIVYYPKSFSGTVYLSDFKGNIRKGWPVDAGRISLTGPELVDITGKNDLKVGFLTQNGELNIWNRNGITLDGFPVKLDGVYNAPFMTGNFSGRNNKREIVTLDKSGRLNIIASDGSVIVDREFKGLGKKEARLEVYDIDGDGLDEIFIYGGTNYIVGMSADAEILPGFPVKGATRPSFYDLNFDGTVELITAGVDDNIYAYSMYF